MPQFYVSLLGGAYTLVEADSLNSLRSTIQDATKKLDTFVSLSRPDGKTVLIAPNDVTLIQPPAPPAFRIPTATKEQHTS